MSKVLVTIIRDNDYATTILFADPKYHLEQGNFVCQGKWDLVLNQVAIISVDTKEVIVEQIARLKELESLHDRETSP